jgi:hypothetical protein
VRGQRLHNAHSRRGTHLNDRIHEVWLRDVVLAVHNLLQDARQDSGAIQLQVHSFQLAQNLRVSSSARSARRRRGTMEAQAHQQVFPNQVAQLLALLLSPVLQRRMS